MKQIFTTILLLMFTTLINNQVKSQSITNDELENALINFKQGNNKLESFNIISKHLICKNLEISQQPYQNFTVKIELIKMLGYPDEIIGERIFRYQIGNNSCSLFIIIDKDEFLESFTIKNCN